MRGRILMHQLFRSGLIDLLNRDADRLGLIGGARRNGGVSLLQNRLEVGPGSLVRTRFFSGDKHPFLGGFDVRPLR